MILLVEEANTRISTRIEKSAQAFLQAKTNIEMQFWNTAANRLYYACYNIVTALLIKEGYSAQTHKGVIHLFAFHYIKTNIIPKEIGKIYHQVFLLRQIADYDDCSILEEDDVTSMLQPVELLIETVKALLKK